MNVKILATDSGDGATEKKRSLTSSKTGQVIKATKGNLYRGIITNPDALDIFFKLYDKASAPDQTDVPIKTIQVKALDKFVFDWATMPMHFKLGLGIRSVSGISDEDAISPTKLPVIELEYK